MIERLNLVLNARMNLPPGFFWIQIGAFRYIRCGTSCFDRAVTWAQAGLVDEVQAQLRFHGDVPPWKVRGEFKEQ